METSTAPRTLTADEDFALRGFERWGTAAIETKRHAKRLWSWDCAELHSTKLSCSKHAAIQDCKARMATLRAIRDGKCPECDGVGALLALLPDKTSRAYRCPTCAGQGSVTA